MISIKTQNNEYFDLYPDTKIQWVRQNPFFREEVDFDAEVSMPFDLPWTPNNSRLLQFAEQLQTNSYLYQVNATVEFKGNEYYKGILTVLRGSRKSYTIAITHNLKQLNLDKLLTELPFETPFSGSIPDASDLNTTTDKFYPEVKFQFPEVANFNPDYVRDFAQVKSSTFHYFNLYEPATGTFQDNTIPVPMVFWEYILDLIQEALGLSNITGLWRLKCKSENYLLYNQVHIADANPTLKIISFGGDPIFKSNGVGSDITLYFRGIGYSIKTDVFNVPINTVIDLTIEIYDVNGPVTSISISHTVVSGDLVNDEVSLLQALETDILAANANFSSSGVQRSTANGYGSLHLTWNVTGQYVSEEDSFVSVTFPAGQFNYHPIELKKHIPSISIRDAFSIVQDWFCLAFEYDIRRNELIITERKDLLSTEEKDYTSKLSGDMIAEINDAVQYDLTWENDEGDLKVESLGEKTIKSYTDANGLDVTEVNIKSGTTFEENLVNSSGGGTGNLISVNHAPGDYDGNPVEPVFRLIKYIGYIPNSLGGSWPYPAATNDTLKPQECYEQYWEPWINFVKSSRKDFEAQFFMDYNDLISFDSRLRWRVESNVLIWREIRTTMTMVGIEPSTVKLKKI